MFRISCSVPGCAYGSTKSSNITRHLKEFHKATDVDISNFKQKLTESRANEKGNEGVWECEQCGHRCSSRKGIDSHILRKHGAPKLLEDPAGISLQDSPEKQPPTPKRALVQGIGDTINLQRISEKKVKTGENGRMMCPRCEKKFLTREDLARHYSEIHCTMSEIEIETFERKEEFDEWLNIRRKETCTDFKIRNSQKERDVQYLVCAHEGAPVVVPNIDRIRKVSKKSTGSALCPCFLKTERVNGRIQVKGYFEHFGHSLEHALRKLSADETETIVCMMKNGFTNRQIIKSLETTYDSSNRLHHTNADDLRYIRKVHGLFEGRFDSNDLASLKKRVERRYNDDGFLLFEPPSDDTGKGFILVIMTPDQVVKAKLYSQRGVCIDDTHNTTKYSLKLTTILVVNGADRGIPIAFMLSASVTSEEVKQLFTCIKDQVPEFNPQFFMSDEARSFWNGFMQVFPCAQTKRILCRWHVQRAWGQQAEKHLSREEAKKVLVSLGEMIREPDRVILDKRICTLMEHLLKSERGSKFADYFRKYYSDTKQEWAAAYRIGAPFQTSMMSEAWHSALKKQLLTRRTNIRIDELVQVLLDGYCWVITRLAKQSSRKLAKSSSRRAENMRNCLKAKKEEHLYLLRQTSDGSVEVLKLAEVKAYIVTDSINCACLAEENTHCNCGACAYRFTCTCLYQMAGIGCKHIHMALKHIRGTELDTPSFDEFGEKTDEDMLPFRRIPSPSHSAVQNRQPESNTTVGGLMDQKLRTHDEFTRCLDKLSAEMRRLLREDGNLQIMQTVLGKIKEVNEVICPTGSTNFPVRRSATSSTAPTAREVMNFNSIKKRSKTRKQPGTFRERGLGFKSDPNCCNVCNRIDPILDPDMDEEEFDARETEWVRCASCKVPTHWLCATSSCSTCNGELTLYRISSESEPE